MFGSVAARPGSRYCELCPDGYITEKEGSAHCTVPVKFTDLRRYYAVIASFVVVLNGTTLEEVELLGTRKPIEMSSPLAMPFSCSCVWAYDIEDTGQDRHGRCLEHICGGCGREGHRSLWLQSTDHRRGHHFQSTDPFRRRARGSPSAVAADNDARRRICEQTGRQYCVAEDAKSDSVSSESLFLDLVIAVLRRDVDVRLTETEWCSENRLRLAMRTISGPEKKC